MDADYGAEHNELADEVKAGLNLLVVAFKNYALYPESNNIRRASLMKVYEWLVGFIADNDSLLLLIAKDSLLFQGDVVLRDKPNEQALIFPLFRDGVQWLEFAEGLSLEEMETFVILLGRFRVLKEEAEDDLVTAMWEAGFTNISYKTADEFWETDPLIDLNSLRVAREQRSDEAGWGSGGAYGAGGGGGGVGLGDSGIGGGAGGGIGGGSGAGAGYGRDGDPSGGPADPARRAARGSGAATGSGPGGGRDGRVVTLEMPPLGVDPTDHLTDKAGAGQVKPISELFSYADGAADDDPAASGGRALPASGEGAVYFDPEDAAQAREAAKLAAGLEAGRGEFFKLTPPEIERLRHLIALEESRNTSKDGLEIVLIVLKELENKIDKGPILDFMFQEIALLLEQGRYAQVRGLMEKMAAMTEAGGPWPAELRAEFQARLASAELLGILKPRWREKRLPDETRAELRKFLLLLPPEAAEALAPVLSQELEPGLENILLEALAVGLSRLRSNPLPLVGKMKVSSILGLLSTFRQLDRPFPETLLPGLTRHGTPAVREAAARLLVEENPENLKSLFYLLEDPQIGIQGWFCSLLGRQRSAMAEKLLYDYLAEAHSGGQEPDRERLLNCYRALGRCGSPQSVAFLEEVLLKRAWKSFFGLEGSAHRLGAAMALMLMPREWGTAEILKKAAQSPFRAVRSACRQAEAELNLS